MIQTKSNTNTATWRRLVVGAISCTALSFVGCDSSPYEMAAVTGTVSIDGTALVNGRVMFVPMSGDGSINTGKPAFGRIQPDGSFVLYTYDDDDGAIVGRHSVAIAVSKEDTPVDPDLVRIGRISLPQPYEVVAGEDNHFDIELRKADLLPRRR